MEFFRPVPSHRCISPAFGCSPVVVGVERFSNSEFDVTFKPGFEMVAVRDKIGGVPAAVPGMGEDLCVSA